MLSRPRRQATTRPRPAAGARSHQKSKDEFRHAQIDSMLVSELKSIPPGEMGMTEKWLRSQINRYEAAEEFHIALMTYDTIRGRPGAAGRG